MQKREFVHIDREPVSERHDDGKDHRGRADYSSPDQDRLRCCFERIARTVVRFEQVLGALEVHVNVEILLQLGLNIGNLLDER